MALLTQVALNAGVRSFTLSAQGLSSPCGDFHLGQVGSDDVESPLTPALFFAGIDLGIGHEGNCIGNPPPTPEPPKWADYYHVRDHLGTLRLVTDISGYVQEAHDYEPFGLELVPPGESIGTLSTRKFTGHERDASTGLDYMMARYYPASLARFFGVDPASASVKPQDPQTWNGYGYVSNNPLAFIDPTGEVLQVAGLEEDKERFKKTAEDNLFGKKVEISEEGKVTLAGNGIEGPPTKEQAALESTLNQAIDNPKTTSLSLVHHDADVLIDSFATGRGDMTDIQCYGQGPGASAAGFLGHFVAEQFKRQVEGVTDFRTAHQAAAAAESAITGYQRGLVSGEIRRTPESGSLIGTQTVQYTRGTEKVNV